MPGNPRIRPITANGPRPDDFHPSADVTGLGSRGPGPPFGPGRRAACESVTPIRPPHGAMWDYHPPKHHDLPHETLAQGSRDFARWTTTELLCDLEKGTMRAAVDGVEVARYSHPDAGERKDPERRILPGPVGMFRHGAGASEYKDIYLEENPKENRLLTVR